MRPGQLREPEGEQAQGWITVPITPTIRRMSDETFKLGDDVFTVGVRGIIIDMQATPSGQWVSGVEDTTGAVN